MSDTYRRRPGDDLVEPLFAALPEAERGSACAAEPPAPVVPEENSASESEPTNGSGGAETGRAFGGAGVLALAAAVLATLVGLAIAGIRA